MARILLIDDDPAVGDALGQLLRSAGHEVTWAADGRPALQLQADRPFDLVVSDILMPGMGGIETIRALRDARDEVPIIAISGGYNLQSEYLLYGAEQFGAVASFSKPIRRGPFLATVSELLGSVAARA